MEDRKVQLVRPPIAIGIGSCGSRLLSHRATMNDWAFAGRHFCSAVLCGGDPANPQQANCDRSKPSCRLNFHHQYPIFLKRSGSAKERMSVVVADSIGEMGQ